MSKKDITADAKQQEMDEGFRAYIEGFKRQTI